MVTPSSMSDRQGAGVLSEESRQDIKRFLGVSVATPEDYVLRQFARHSVVLLAERHRIKHNLELIHNLIPLLHAAGVYNLGMEFGASEDQQDLDDLITGSAYDEQLARSLMFNYNVGWAYAEYMDVYRKAWELNRGLPRGSPRFRVVNLSYKYDWSGFTGPRTPDNMRKVFHRGDIERFRARIVEGEVLEKGEKIVILTGTQHAFTRYRVPEYDYYSPGFVMLREVTFGNHLESIAPGQCRTVLLHSPWRSRDMRRQIRPLGGIIDDVMEEIGQPRLGFDVSPSPFEAVRECSSWFSVGYPDFTLASITDGYVYEKPFRSYEGCTVDDLFLTEANWPQAEKQIPDPDWNGRPRSREEYIQSIRDLANMETDLRGVR
jgi:hypothetical protein